MGINPISLPSSVLYRAWIKLPFEKSEWFVLVYKDGADFYQNELMVIKILDFLITHIFTELNNIEIIKGIIIKLKIDWKLSTSCWINIKNQASISTFLSPYYHDYFQSPFEWLYGRVYSYFFNFVKLNSLIPFSH